MSALGVVAALSIQVRAQTPAKASAAAAAPAKPYTTPRTSWGGPDISGTWSSDDLRNVPVQRPAELGTRAQLSDEEYAKRLADNNEARARELNRVGAFRNDFGTRTFRQTSLVVEPAETTNFIGNTTGVGGNGGGPPTSDVLHPNASRAWCPTC